MKPPRAGRIDWPEPECRVRLKSLLEGQVFQDVPKERKDQMGELSVRICAGVTLLLGCLAGLGCRSTSSVPVVAPPPPPVCCEEKVEVRVEKTTQTTVKPVGIVIE
mgnify:FL=1|jgi:hypothetical protein